MSRLIFEVMPHGPMVRHEGEWRDATLSECGAEIERLSRLIGLYSQDRARILREVDVCAPEDAPRIRLDSYARINPAAPIAGAGAGNN